MIVVDSYIGVRIGVIDFWVICIIIKEDEIFYGECRERDKSRGYSMAFFVYLSIFCNTIIIVVFYIVVGLCVY